MDPLAYRYLRFPDRAGELQQAGNLGQLVTELGDNYAKYHDYLAELVAQHGARPEPDDYDDLGSYLAAVSFASEVLNGEAFLRTCRARRVGASDGPVSLLVDEWHRLVDHTGRARRPKNSPSDPSDAVHVPVPVIERPD